MALDKFTEKVAYKINVWEGRTRAQPGYTEFRLDTGFDSLNQYFRFLQATHEPFSVKGWTQKGNQSIEYKGVFADMLTKGTCKVFHINESDDPYSGRLKTCFFAEDKESLEMLCRDWGFNSKMIAKDQSVEQLF